MSFRLLRLAVYVRLNLNSLLRVGELEVEDFLANLRWFGEVPGELPFEEFRTSLNCKPILEALFGSTFCDVMSIMGDY
jgi:hypothetical protein